MYVIANVFVGALTIMSLRELMVAKKGRKINTTIAILSILSFIYTINSSWRY